jgi:hypothetical protein
MITAKRAPGTKVVYVGATRPWEGEIVAVDHQRKLVSIRVGGRGDEWYEMRDRYLVPKAAYREPGAFKWEILPYQWIDEETHDV